MNALTKKCSICGIEKLVSEFYLCKSCRGRNVYLSYCCKGCDKKRKDIKKEKERAKRYRIKNSDKINEYARIWYANHKDRKKEYQLKNKKKIQERQKKYFQKTKDFWNDYNKIRYKINFNVKLRQNLAGKINKYVREYNKSEKTMVLLGYSLKEFRQWFEDWFKEPENKGMNWKNFMNGKIHIDHIIPCSRFDLQHSEEQELCFNYSNLQPLWAKDNISKQDRFIG